jgi:endonuclease YncB( thermonuclease family)
MSSTNDRIIRFERRPPPRRSSKRTFPAIVIGLAASVFAAVIYWPTSQAPDSQAPAHQTYVAPTLTTPNSTHQDTGVRFRCTVTSVYDGDGPIHCREGASIRLNAIAAREMDGTCRPGQPCPEASALEAKHELQSIVLGHILSCRQTGTSYNRVVAICWTESGLEVNCAMVRSGKALLWDRYNRQNRICS